MENQGMEWGGEMMGMWEVRVGMRGIRVGMRVMGMEMVSSVELLGIQIDFNLILAQF